MAVLSANDRAEIWAKWMRENTDASGTLTKADLKAAVDAIDQWSEDNTAAFNNAIPQPARNRADDQTEGADLHGRRDAAIPRPVGRTSWPRLNTRCLPEEAQFLATAFPAYVKFNGTNFPVSGLAFDAATDEAAFWKLIAQNYAAGNVTVNILWYADTATSGNVIFDAQIAAITPNTDTTDVETKAFAAISSVTDSHLGTTGHRLHTATIAVSNLDALAADDLVWLRLNRDANNASDTMTGDAIVLAVEVTYSDT